MSVVAAGVVPHRSRLSRSEHRALAVWLVSRPVTLLLPVLLTGWLLDREAGWGRWDVEHFQAVARDGYDAPGETPYAAFFPALPLLLRVLGSTGADLTVVGLLVSAVAGGVAAVALTRLARLEGEETAGPRAVLLLVTSPPAVFLTAGYTEALFLALALPAWYAARTERWWLAGALAAGAASVRVTGLFLALALVVHWATAARRRSVSHLLPLALPALPVLGFMLHLRLTTGSWWAWVEAQRVGWEREPTWPWDAWSLTWAAAFQGQSTPGDANAFRMELLAVVVGVVLTGWLALGRRWGELTFVGASVLTLVCSTWFFSVPRASLLWWPLWLLLARATLRRPVLLVAWLALSTPVALYWATRFSAQLWAG